MNYSSIPTFMKVSQSHWVYIIEAWLTDVIQTLCIMQSDDVEEAMVDSAVQQSLLERCADDAKYVLIL